MKRRLLQSSLRDASSLDEGSSNDRCLRRQTGGVLRMQKGSLSKDSGPFVTDLS